MFLVICIAFTYVIDHARPTPLVRRDYKQVISERSKKKTDEEKNQTSNNDSG